jgi:hypothetical protein
MASKIAPWRVQYGEVLRKTLYKPSKSESCTGFCRILLIKETNRRMPDSTQTVEFGCQLAELQDGEAPRVLGNRKGCDFGYALADNSCEGALGVDACTVTALDAATAFAVPDPSRHLAARLVFSGLSVLPSHLVEPATQHTSGQLLLRCQPFSAVDEGNPNIEMRDVNAQGWCKPLLFSGPRLRAQLAEKSTCRLLSGGNISAFVTYFSQTPPRQSFAPLRTTSAS